MKKLWILGKHGLLGKTFARLCEEKGVPFVATGREEANITHLNTLNEVLQRIQPTHIVNCTAYNDVDNAEKETDLAYAVNALGPENLGRISASKGVKVIHISTDYVFDGKKSSPYGEDDLSAPLSIYGKSKREGEIKLLKAHPDSLIIRTSWLFGKGGKSFISSLLAILKTKEEIKTPSNQIGSPTFAKDLAEAILLLLDQKGIFHFANAGATSRYEIARYVLEWAREKKIPLSCRTLMSINYEEIGFLAQRPSYSALDLSKITQALGFSPRPWQEAMKEYVNENS